MLQYEIFYGLEIILVVSVNHVIKLTCLTQSIKSKTMRIIINFIFLILYAKNESAVCDSNDLELPENAEGWSCSKQNLNLVQKGGKCEIRCEKLFKLEKREYKKSFIQTKSKFITLMVNISSTVSVLQYNVHCITYCEIQFQR